MSDEAEALGRTLLAEIGRAVGSTPARRLTRGAVLADGHLDLTGIGAAVWTVLRGLDPALGLRGLWLADNGLGAKAGAPLAELLGRHAQLEHVELAGNGLASSLLRVVPALARLRSLGLADNASDAATTGRLARMLEGTGGLHVALGRRAGAGGARGQANVLDDAAAEAWAAALERGAGWASLDLRGVSLTDAGAERLLRAVARSRLARLSWDRELPPTLLARLCHQANRARVAPPPELSRLLRAVPAEPEVPPLPAAWAELEHELAAATRLVERLSERRELLADAHPRVAALRRGLARALRVERSEARRAVNEGRSESARRLRREADRRRVEEAGIRRRSGGTAPTPTEERDAGATIHELHTPRPCYICKQPYKELHFFYDRLCPACAAESYVRRGEAVDLRGCQAIVTGGRIKIGFEVALRLLRWGARVLVTSRFPRDTIRRFAAQPDFSGYRDRLQVHGLDLRAVPAIELFAAHVTANYPRVDVLINNAAQTVRRSPQALAAIAAEEALALPDGLESLVAGEVMAAEAGSQPALVRGEFGEPLDTRAENSWRLKLHEVGTVELLEVQLVNVVAPYLLNARLRPVMARRRAEEAAYIVNVSAPEGRFDRLYKSPYHPHTNMAKAALNMMTRTSAEEYAADGIYMTSVDPGWASNENPEPIAAAMRARGFMPPLDLVDAAARVCDPVARGRRDGERLFGVFLKDFRQISW